EGRIGAQATLLAAECLALLNERRFAADALTVLLKRDPNSKEANRLLAAIYIDLNSPYQAIEHLREWGRLDPATGVPYRWIGLFCKDYHKPAEAAAAYREACRRELQTAERAAVLSELAETMIDGQSDYAAALELLASGPDDFLSQPAILVLRARCCWALGRTDEARRLVQDALRQNPKLVSALRVHAEMLLSDGLFKDALPLLEKAVEVDPADL